MRCKKAKELISPYMDGELSEGERKMIESHMKDCGNCRAEFEEIQHLHNLVAGAERFNAPYGFSTRILANQETKTLRNVLLVPLFARFAGMVAVLMIIGIGIVSGRFIGRSFSFQKAGNIAALFSLDIFEPTPPDSVGGVYLAMTEARDEE
jgi:predicted anti-sigma-YlaC factor YlaD